MGFSRRFVTGLAWRMVLLLATAFAFVQSLQTEGLGAARLVAGTLCLAAVIGLWRFVRHTNVEMARFVEAVKFGDLAQGFSGAGRGSGFGEFGEALDAGMAKLRDERHRLSEANRFYEAVLDDAPTALLVIDGEGRVELGNKAARRLLIRHQGVRVEDFREYGDAFATSLGENSVGRPRLVPLLIDGVPQTAMVSAAVVHRLGGLVRVVAVQPIQGELNAVEIAAQSDLVRVLTHEIMNSMTPVTSLAHSAAELMAKADKAGANGDVTDARAAVETLARRADGVMHFVESYRQISRAPELRRRLFEVAPWAGELEALFKASGAADGVAFMMEVAPGLSIDADPDLLFQVLINLLRNGAEAARANGQHPALSLSFALTRGGRTRIEVADNGAGVPETLRKDVFLPFFTTKPKGTGVGLSLARQIVLAHRGSISLANSQSGGALFRIVI